MTKTKSWGILLLLTVAFVMGRLSAYGDLRDSVAANDTDSYFECASGDFTKIAYYECSRPATIPFLIQLLNGDDPYELTVMSEPYFGSEARLAVQPGTEKLVIFQTLLSIFAWTLLAWVLCGFLRHDLAKVCLMALIYAFAFVPQLADWDSILLSESLSFSFFALMAACLCLFLQGAFTPTRFWKRLLYTLLLCVSAVFWVFTRDTNAYFLLFVAIVLLVVFLVAILRNKRFLGLTLLLVVAFGELFFFQQQTFQTSQRWLLPLMNNLTANVFPYPERVAFFQERGMPVSDAILAQQGSAEYNQIYQQPELLRWAQTSGTRDYMAFLLDMPLWNLQQVFLNLDSFFNENIQPFFYGDSDQKPHWADQPGNLLHPLSAAVILIDLFLLLVLFAVLVRRQDGRTLAWWLFCGLLVGGGLLLMVISYLGEVRSIWRHVLSGVMLLRLMLWVQLIVMLDFALEIPPALPVITRLAGSQTPLSDGKI